MEKSNLTRWSENKIIIEVFCFLIVMQCVFIFEAEARIDF